MLRAVSRTAPRAGRALGCRTKYDLAFPAIDDAARQAVTEDELRGKAVLVTNTASLCGYTPQLGELQLLHERFAKRGLVVLGVPSNDFGDQEPWDDDKIHRFYHVEYGVRFPLTSKQKVTPPGEHPFYSQLRDEFGDAVLPAWNFHSILLDRDGNLAGIFPPGESPLSPQTTHTIEEMLGPEDPPSDEGA